MPKYKKGLSYLVRGNNNRYLDKVTILDITEKCYEVKYVDANASTWYTIEYFENSNELIEELPFTWAAKPTPTITETPQQGYEIFGYMDDNGNIWKAGEFGKIWVMDTTGMRKLYINNHP